MLAELEIVRATKSSVDMLEELGELTPLNCPRCGGPLWRIEDAITRFRCREGHAYTAKSLLLELGESLERSMWMAVQMMDERVRTLERLADYGKERPPGESAASFHDEAALTQEYANHLREFLLKLNQL